MAQYKIVRPDTPVESIIEQGGSQTMFPVVDKKDNTFKGYILMEDVKEEQNKNKTAGQILEAVQGKESRVNFVLESTPLKDALSLMANARLPFMPVVDNQRRYKGTIDPGSVAAL